MQREGEETGISMKKDIPRSTSNEPTRVLPAMLSKATVPPHRPFTLYQHESESDVNVLAGRVARRIA